MPMNQLDFDHPVERRGTASFKWDGAEAAFGRGDVIPLWVADMDFPCAPEILEAFEARIRHGVMGYTIRTPRYLEAVRGWFRSRHGWEVPEEHLAFAPPGVIFAVNVLIDILTKPGDRIVMQTPNYDALMSSVTEGGRILAENPLKVENGRYTLDFDGLERELARPEGSWEERVARFFQNILRHRDHGILVMTQREEADLHSRLAPERFRDFRPGQRAFMLRLMALLEIREADCPPEVLANLVFSCLLIYNSAPESMPFLFPDYLDETAELHVRFLVKYLSQLHHQAKDR